MWFIPEGRFDLYLDVNGQQVLYYKHQNDTATGGVGGLLPYSRMKLSPGYIYAAGKTKRYTLHMKYFQELERLNPKLTQRLIGYMTERSRSVATIQLQHEKISNGFDNDSFTDVLQWLDNLLISQKMLKDLEESSTRISTLVGAIKSHVHMDQSYDSEPTDIRKDIENTLTLIGYKLREKNIKVNKLFAENMPEIPAYVGELNQVWANIIDNAIYAMPKNGELIIDASYDSKNVYVKIIDNGHGIPEEIMSRIFDPFFTTKKVGEGTGIGLDLVNRIIKHHNGEIKVESIPGRTEFAVSIPY